MKIQVLDVNKFTCFSVKDIEKEKIVYATCKVKNKEYFLVESNDGLLDFIRKNKYISVIDDTIPKDWTFIKKFIDKETNPQEGIIVLKDLYCPKWMIEDKSFFFEVCLDKKVARTKFLENIKK